MRYHGHNGRRVPVAANVLGTIGAVCWSVQLIPQIVINHRRHNAIGLQPTMMMLWAWAGVPLGVYNIARDYNTDLKIQPQILTLLSLITWIQCCYYEKKWSAPRSLALVIPVACTMGGIQAALIIALRIAKDRQLQWPLTVMAVLSAALFAAGVLRHYLDIYLHRTVRGISFLFVGIDAAGDVFSLVSVVFQPELDILGLVIYGTELIMWIGVFACGGYYNLLPWLQKKFKRGERDMHDFGGGRVSATCARTSGRAIGPVTEAIALHEFPSSTSVFRTPSGELDMVRQRGVTSRGNFVLASGP